MTTRQDDDDFDERGILRDGRSYRPMRFLDSQTRPVHDVTADVTDVFGGPVGQRNGYAIPKPGSELAQRQKVNEALRLTEEAKTGERWRPT